MPSAAHLDTARDLTTGVTAIASASLSAASGVARVWKVTAYDSSPPSTPTLSGDGLSYGTPVRTVNFAGQPEIVWIFVATGDPTAGAVTASITGGADYVSLTGIEVSDATLDAVYEGEVGYTGEVTLAGTTFDVDVTAVVHGNAVLALATKLDSGADAWTAVSPYTLVHEWEWWGGVLNTRSAAIFEDDLQSGDDAMTFGHGSQNFTAAATALEFSFSSSGGGTTPNPYYTHLMAHGGL